jgi:hypothetical protein
MPCCNGADRGCAARQHHPTRKRADFPLVWRHERTWQTDFRGRRRYVGSGNACWCGPRAWQHGLSAPGGYREGFFRQAKAGRVWAIRPYRGCNSVVEGGLVLPPRPTGKQRHTNAELDRTACPVVVAGLHWLPSATMARAVVGETAFCEGRKSRLELHASEGCPCSS